jgi:hypothetical protein
MTSCGSPESSMQDLRVRAVLALFNGDTAAQVSARYGIGRSKQNDMAEPEQAKNACKMENYSLQY